MKRRSPNFDPKRAEALVRHRQETLTAIGALAAHWVVELDGRPSRNGELYATFDDWPYAFLTKGKVSRNVQPVHDHASIAQSRHLIVERAGTESDALKIRLRMDRHAGWGNPSVRLPRRPGYERRASLTLYPSRVPGGPAWLSVDVSAGTKGTVLWNGSAGDTTPRKVGERAVPPAYLYASEVSMRRAYAWYCTNALGLTALVSEGLRVGYEIESNTSSLKTHMDAWRADSPETAHSDPASPLWRQTDVRGLNTLLESR